MSEEEKKLLFGDLCARLPYSVKISVKENDTPQTNTNMKKIAFFVLCIMMALANIILLAFVLSNIVSQPTTMYISNPIYKDWIIPTILFSAFTFMWLLAAKNTDNIIK